MDLDLEATSWETPLRKIALVDMEFVVEEVSRMMIIIIFVYNNRVYGPGPRGKFVGDVLKKDRSGGPGVSRGGVQ